MTGPRAYFDEERRSVAEFMRESIVFCSTCTMSSLRKFTFAISSPDELRFIQVRSTTTVLYKSKYGQIYSRNHY